MAPGPAVGATNSRAVPADASAPAWRLAERATTPRICRPAGAREKLRRVAHLPAGTAV